MQSIKYNVGIGLTNACNLNCPHCYSRISRKSLHSKITSICFSDLKLVCEKLKVNSINLGTGESWLHPQFLDIFNYLHAKKIKLSLTTNGFTASKLTDEELTWLNDIDFSLDFPTAKAHNLFRGQDVFEKVIKNIKRCKKLGVETSIVTVLMNSNYKYMGEMVELAKKLDVNLRVNVYKAVRSKEYKPTYAEFWKGIKFLFKKSQIISCSEPIVNAAINNVVSEGGSPCGKNSLRITPDGKIVPCVFWNRSDLKIKDLLKNKAHLLEEGKEAIRIRKVPEECMNCEQLTICKGGCAARRVYNNLNKPDEYCFKIRNNKPRLDYKFGETKDLVHSNYLCTIIVKGR